MYIVNISSTEKLSTAHFKHREAEQKSLSKIMSHKSRQRKQGVHQISGLQEVGKEGLLLQDFRTFCFGRGQRSEREGKNVRRGALRKEGGDGQVKAEQEATGRRQRGLFCRQVSHMHRHKEDFCVNVLVKRVLL